MSLSRAQQILLKRAQKEAGLMDFDYRSALAIVSGMEDCLSSTDPRLSDRHFDNLLAYFEAIHWQAVDAGRLQASCKANAVFRERGFWAGKNPAGNTSRDRYAQSDLAPQVAAAERTLATLGCSQKYCQAIENNLRQADNFTLANYLASLNRTIKSKSKPEASGDPY